jgi:hypothetical protein
LYPGETRFTPRPGMAIARNLAIFRAIKEDLKGGDIFLK